MSYAATRLQNVRYFVGHHTQWLFLVGIALILPLLYIIVVEQFYVVAESSISQSVSTESSVVQNGALSQTTLTALYKHKQNAYLLLSLLLLLTLLVAAWLARQTNWKRRHDVLQQRLRDHEQAARQLKTETQTSLTTIAGYARLLQKSGSLDQQNNRYAVMIDDSATRALQQLQPTVAQSTDAPTE